MVNKLSRSYDRSTESSRRGQRLREGRSSSPDESHASSRRGRRLRDVRSSSKDRSPDGSHARLPGSLGRSDRERRSQSFGAVTIEIHRATTMEDGAQQMDKIKMIQDGIIMTHGDVLKNRQFDSVS